MACGDPWQGGATWAIMQYVLGLRDLGHDVWLVEPVREQLDLAYVDEVVREFQVEDRVAFLVDERQTVGLPYERLCATSFDAHFNFSGMLRDPELVGATPVRVYVDLDPAFNQLWHAVDGIDVGLDGHTHFITVGQSLGKSGCSVPTCGVRWIATLPPVHLESWPCTPGSGEGYTTVGNWRSYGSITVDGTLFGQRAHSMRSLFSLPRLIEPRVAVALAIDPAETSDLEGLRLGGWRLIDPMLAAGTPSRYRRFIQKSRAELSVAKSGYVESRCGWFSDRSACYLASGRPVVAQDTGFGEALPTGRGLLLFDDLEAAAATVEEIERDYDGHAAAARKLAVEHLDAVRVLRRLLDAVGLE